MENKPSETKPNEMERNDIQIGRRGRSRVHQTILGGNLFRLCSLYFLSQSASPARNLSSTHLRRDITVPALLYISTIVSEQSKVQPSRENCPLSIVQMPHESWLSTQWLPKVGKHKKDIEKDKSAKYELLIIFENMFNDLWLSHDNIKKSYFLLL